QSSYRQIVLGVFADISNKAIEGVIRRVDGPNDLIQNAGGVAGGLTNLAGVGLDLGRGIFVAFHKLTQQGDLGEAGPKLVVNIAGNASAFFFKGLLLPEPLQLSLQPLSRYIINRATNAAQGTSRKGAQKPPGFIERRLHD